MTVTIHHELPGRTRLRLATWPEPSAIAAMDRALARIGGVIARLSAATGSILILHPEALSASDIQRHVAATQASQPEDHASQQEQGPSTPHADALPPSDEIDAAAVAPVRTVLEQLGSRPNGLTAEDAARRLEQQGLNQDLMPFGRSHYEMLTEQFATLPVAMLAGSALLSVATGGIVDALVTLSVVALNAGIGFSSESATENLIRRLSRPIEHDALLTRDGRIVVSAASKVVEGDVISVSSGTFVPADVRVIEAHHLAVDESSLTGESLPVEKSADPLPHPPASVAERANILHKGTVVTEGHGQAVAIATGRRTEMARTRAMIGTARPPRPAIEDELAWLGRRLTVGCLAASGLMAVIGLLRGESLLTISKSAIALAVAAIPEGLPAVSTSSLALGAKSMEKERAFVRALPAIEALATVDTICLDKTGTLTENRMQVVAAAVDGQTLEPGADRQWQADAADALRPLAEAVVLCNEASLADESGSATELALLRFAEAVDVDPDTLRKRFPTDTLHSRNRMRRWMATEHIDGGRRFVAVKGAPDELLALSSHERHGPEVRELDEARRAQILKANAHLASKGLRVLGVARGEGEMDHTPHDLVFLGLVALADPIRAEARDAIAAFHRAGIRTIILTGDQPATALAVAEELALSRTGIIPVMETSRFIGLSDHEVGELALKTSVFARVSPADKLRIVKGLQAVGRRVAMMGDGVNDGPALRAAAIGVAMGETGTDVAREVADIVIADDNLHALSRAIARGRATDDNIRTAIRYFLSTNLSEVLVMLGEVLHGKSEMETPMELFWLNLVTDILPGLGLTLAEPRGDVMARPPRAADAPIFSADEARSMLLDGGSIAASALAGHFLRQAGRGPGPQARTVTFLTLALSQIAHAWVLRDRSQRASDTLGPSEIKLLSALGASSALLGVAFVLPPLRRLLGIAVPSVGDLALSGALAGASFLSAEARRQTIPEISARAATSPETPPARTE
jgi:Ca2+-transporting ATPase